MEEKRPGQYYPIEEDASGTFVFNPKDLCLLPHLPELIQSGVNSLKIEGRVKLLLRGNCGESIQGSHRRLL